MRSFSNFKNGTAILQVRWFLSTQFPGSLLFLFFLCTSLYTSELTWQNGRKKRTAKSLCVTNVTGLLLECFVEILQLIFRCSGLIQKYLFRRRRSLAGKCSKRNYCHVCHARFVVSFPLRSYCVSSLLLWGTERRYTYESVCFPHFFIFILFYFLLNRLLWHNWFNITTDFRKSFLNIHSSAYPFVVNSSTYIMWW